MDLLLQQTKTGETRIISSNGDLTIDQRDVEEWRGPVDFSDYAKTMHIKHGSYMVHA